MAKNAPVKKSKRKLKRSVRRSVAAVLMITAIGVAAIPVPENLAAPDEEGTDASPLVKYEAAKTPTTSDGGTDWGDYEQNDSSTKHDYVDVEYDSETVANAIKAGTLIATENIVQTNEEGPLLTWQFLFKPLSTTNGVLCKYNRRFTVASVELGLAPIKNYYMVTATEFNAYFSAPTTVSDALKWEMYNLNSTTGEAVPNTIYPTEEITLSYANYNSGSGTFDITSVVQRNFLNEYYAVEMADLIDKFKRYDDNTSPDKGAAPKDEVKASPKNLDINNKIKFFCDQSSVLSGSDYKLTPVKDYRIGQTGQNTVYVAYGGDPSKLQPGIDNIKYVDYKGYAVVKDGHLIDTIGEKAFFEVTNVGQIEISGQVGYIGDSAFEGSGISSLYIDRADMIGNRAFAGCVSLKTVTFGEHPGTAVIGAEAFRGSGINTKLSFPSSIKTIGHGAFSDCVDLSEIEFDQNTVTSNLTIKNYAFFDDTNLTKVEFGKCNVAKIGKAGFAIQSPSGDVMSEFSFPTGQLNGLDDYVLANRRGLQTVSIPKYSGVIPVTTFYNCFGLEKVQFSDDSAYASFEPKLFYYVTNPNFCVYGPEFYYGSDPAQPRQSTWDAVRRDEVPIPYIYESGGRTFYEVGYVSEDGTRYRYGAGNDGELISCALIPPIPSSGMVDIVIPSQIGSYAIKSIGSTCFSDKDLRGRIRSVTIQNNSVSEIANGTFRDLKNLEKVRIGNSVTRIGDNAFAGCNVLYDVYFATPSAGYGSVYFGDGAFVTTGKKLTFHGDIVKGYAPYEYAANKANILRDPENRNAPDINVCYQSLWDSTVGTHLTVILNPNDGDNGTMTLVDYPKISDLSIENVEKDDELQDYCRDMENYYYYTAYDSGSEIERLRREYALIWYASHSEGSQGDRVDLGGTVIERAQYESELNKRYGPWINPSYCGDNSEAGYWTTYLPAQASNADGNHLIDFLFEPLVTYAASIPNPKPYFAAYPYNFMENYKSYLTDPLYDTLPDYKKVPDKVWNYINATQSIVVPDGVDSIDVNRFFTECKDNYGAYVYNTLDRLSSVSPEVNSMYTSINNGATPGLFSGYYKDFDDGDSREDNINGNDYIKSIVLTSVKSLPDYAFDSCEQLERVELGAVEKIGALPFRGCPNLTYLTGSEKYPAENGILYEKKEGTPETYKIVECLMTRGKLGTGDEGLENPVVSPGLGDVLLGSVTEIAESAFEGCNSITQIDLTDAEGLEVIPVNCFKDCSKLTLVKLPRTVNKINEGAFKGITSTEYRVRIPGREVDIADEAFQPKNNVIICTYADSAAYRYAIRYKNEEMRVETLDAYRVMFYDYDGVQVGTTQIVEAGNKAMAPAEEETLREKDHRPGYMFDGWLSTGGKTLDDVITDDMTIFIAQYISDGTMVNGKYVVEFLDGIDGHRLSGLGADEQDGKYYIPAGTSFMDNGKSAPTYAAHEGYTFLEWSQNWTENTIINSNMTIIALYSADNPGGGSGGTSGGSTNTSRGSGNSGGGSGTSSRNSSSSGTGSSSSSASTSSTTSGSNSTAGKYTVTVENGSGSGSYDVGSTVVIAANDPAPGMVFQKWTTESNGVALASVSMPATTFTMPANNVTVTANYVAAGTAAGSSNTGNSSTTGNGSTRVDITKPGISNKDLATANVNGSTDNFIVKITETDEATRAVAEALTNKYGSLDNILYYAMDISLYDSTGTVKITNTAGLSVDITIPIPDALVAYGGNNMAGAVINGNQLENLNESFTTINGVPCIRFTATHFSPYTIYVDTGNLTEGMLDTTPKTGDPIHPKWFLSIGLACLSVILFMKKDKAVKVKTA